VRTIGPVGPDSGFGRLWKYPETWGLRIWDREIRGLAESGRRSSMLAVVFRLPSFQPHTKSDEGSDPVRCRLTPGQGVPTAEAGYGRVGQPQDGPEHGAAARGSELPRRSGTRHPE